MGLSQYICGIISINSGLNTIYSGLNIMHSGINLIYSVGLTYMVDPSSTLALYILFNFFLLNRLEKSESKKKKNDKKMEYKYVLVT